MSNEKGMIKQWDKKADRIETYEIKEITIEVAKEISGIFGVALGDISIVYSSDAYFFRVYSELAGAGDLLVKGIVSHGMISVYKRSDIERDFTEVSVMPAEDWRVVGGTA